MITKTSIILATLATGIVLSAAFAQPQHYAFASTGFRTSIEHAEKTADGGMIMTGQIADQPTEFGFEPSDIWVVKYDASGNVQWQRRFGQPLDWEGGVHVQELAAGGYIIAFSTDSTSLNQQGLLRLTAAGAQVWSRTYSGQQYVGDSEGYVVRELPDGRLLMTGKYTPQQFGPTVAALHILDSAGAPLAQYTLSGGANYTFSNLNDAKIISTSPLKLLVGGRIQFIDTQTEQYYDRAFASVLQLDPLVTTWCKAYGPVPAPFNGFAYSSVHGLEVMPATGDAILNGQYNYASGIQTITARGVFLFTDGAYISRINLATGNENWMTVIGQVSPASTAVRMSDRPYFAASHYFGDGNNNGVVYGFDFATGTPTQKNLYSPPLDSFGLNSRFSTLIDFPGPGSRYWLPAGEAYGFFGNTRGYFARADAQGYADCHVTDPNLPEYIVSDPPLTIALSFVSFANSASTTLTPSVPSVALVGYACDVVQCGPADVGQQGGIPGPDGVLDNNDFVAFIDLYFAQDPAADVGQQGGIPGADGAWDNNDFVAFIDLYFAGCSN